MANVTGGLAPDKNFERVANTPGAWEGIARTLLTAAQILRERREAGGNSVALNDDGDPVPLEWMVPVERMLRGFALENLMKAWWVKQEHAIACDGKYIGVGDKHRVPDHKLAPLAKAVGVPVDRENRKVLEQLSVS